MNRFLLVGKRGRFVGIALASVMFAGNQGFAQTTAPSSVAQKSITTQPSESHYSRTPEQEISFQQGLLYYSRKQLPAAEGQFAQVVKNDGDDSDAFYYLGLSQLDQNKAADAVKNFDRAISLDPTLAEARAARATANIRLQKYDAADADLNDLAADPAWASLVHYLRGQEQYAKGNLDTAAKEFAAAKRAGGTEAEPAGFYEGLTYLRMRELVRARSAFSDSSALIDRDPTVAAASRQLDNVLAQQQQQAKPYSFTISLGYEYDTNVIQLGSNVPLPGGISDKKDWRFVVQPRGSYSLYRKGDVDMGIEGSGYFTWQHEVSSFDIESYQAGPFINYRVAKNLFASARYGFNYIRVGHDGFLARNLVTPQLTYVEPKFGYSSIYYQFQTRNFISQNLTSPNNSAAQNQANSQLDRDGYSNAVGIVQGVSLPAFFVGAKPANLEVSYRFEDQVTKGQDYDAALNTIGTTLYVPLPFWKMRADVGVSLDFDEYRHPNTLDAGGDTRHDFEFNVVTGLTKDINANWAVRVDYTYTNNDSNITQADNSNPFDFDRNQFGVRLIGSF